MLLDRRRRRGRGASNRRRLVAGQSGQQRQRLLVAARLDGGDGFQLFGIGGVFLEQQDRRARFVERSLGGGIFLLRQRRIDRRQQRVVMGLEHGLRRLNPLGRVRRLQGQRTERCLDMAPQFVVEAYRRGAIRGLLATGAPVSASMILPSGWVR